MSTRIPTIFALFVIWLILAASYDLVHLVLGAFAAVLVVWLNPVADSSPFRNLSWWGLLVYLPWLFIRILKSGIHVSRLILAPSLPHPAAAHPAFDRARVRGRGRHPRQLHYPDPGHDHG